MVPFGLHHRMLLHSKDGSKNSLVSELDHRFGLI